MSIEPFSPALAHKEHSSPEQSLTPASSELEKLLREAFHLVPVRTQRHDQWYKRSYQSWRDRVQDPSRDLLILTAKQSKDEWAPQLKRCATELSRAIKARSQDLANETRHLASYDTNSKLFTDDLIDESEKSTFMTVLSGEPALPLQSRRLSYWETPGTPFRSTIETYKHQAVIIKALLALGRVDVLSPLARAKRATVKYAASITPPKKQSRRENEDAGWMTIIDDVLKIYLFLHIKKCFTAELDQNKAFECWVPFAMIARYIEPSLSRYAASVTEDMTKERRKRSDHLEATQCFETMCVTDVLLQECGLPAVDWESKMMDAFMYFIGFEAWNRSREGDGYLFCDFNKTKGSKWLLPGAGGQNTSTSDDEGVADRLDQDHSRSRRSRSVDPLYLREPKKELVPKTDENDDGEKQDILAEMESKEAEFGKKRSQKYMRKS